MKIYSGTRSVPLDKHVFEKRGTGALKKAADSIYWTTRGSNNPGSAAQSMLTEPAMTTLWGIGLQSFI